MVFPELVFSENFENHDKRLAYLFPLKNHKQDGPTFKKDRA